MMNWRDFWEGYKIFFFGVTIVVMLAVGSFWGYKTFGVAYENVRTDIYRENKSFVEGNIREIRELKMRWETSEPEHRDSIRSLIIHRSNDLDWSKLPKDLQEFLNEIRSN